MSDVIFGPQTTLQGWSPTFGVTYGNLTVASPGGAASHSYTPGDVSTLAGGTFSQAATVAILQTQVVSATVAAGGSGGTNGTQTVTGTTGSGTLFQASVTVSGGAITAVLSISRAGAYTTNPTVLTAEPVTGAGLVGAQLSVVMGAQAGGVQQTGIYSAVPNATSALSESSSTGSGIGATWNVAFGPIASTISFQATNSFNFALGPSAGASQTLGTENLLVGIHAGESLTVGGFNTAVGCSALLSQVTGGQNSAFGDDTLKFYTYNQPNSAFGSQALKNWEGGGGNSVFGYSTMSNYNTTDTGGSALNCAFGDSAMLGTAGSGGIRYNSAYGADSLYHLQGAQSNTAIGYLTGFQLTSGSSNTIVGAAVASTTLATGSNNVLIGTSSSIDTASSSTSNTIQIGAGSTAIISATGCGTPSSSVLTAAGSLVVNSATGGITVGSSGPTLTSGSGAPSATQPVGSLYLNTSGSSGSRLYVSAGSGSWNAVSGV